MSNTKNEEAISLHSLQMSVPVVASTPATATDTPTTTKGTVVKNLKHIPCNHISFKMRGKVVWLPNRKCPHQSKCWYSHSHEEYKAALIPKPCFRKRPDGTCDVQNCRFDHSIDVTTTPPAQRKFTHLCKFVREDGTCRYGASCIFYHSVEEMNKAALVTANAVEGGKKRKATPFLIDMANESDSDSEDTEGEGVVVTEDKLNKAIDVLRLAFNEDDISLLIKNIEMVEEYVKQGDKPLELSNVSEQVKIDVMKCL